MHGTFYALDEEAPPPRRATFERALVLLRALVPETLDHDDPAPFRDVVFGIHVDTLTGRAAASGA